MTGEAQRPFNMTCGRPGSVDRPPISSGSFRNGSSEGGV